MHEAPTLPGRYEIDQWISLLNGAMGDCIPPDDGEEFVRLERFIAALRLAKPLRQNYSAAHCRAIEMHINSDPSGDAEEIMNWFFFRDQLACPFDRRGHTPGWRPASELRASRAPLQFEVPAAPGGHQGNDGQETGPSTWLQDTLALARR